MIVECRSCSTRFRLDEAKVPAKGAKVRCSRCKTAFVVHRPGVSPSQLLDEVVAEVTDPGAPLAPDPSQDLFETVGSEGLVVGADEGSDQAQWEFDEPPRTGDARSVAEPEPRAGRSEAEDLDSVGSPEDWDLLAGARKLASEARFEADPPRGPSGAAPTRDSATQPSFESGPGEPAAIIPARRATPGWRDALRDAAHDALQRSAWLAASLVCATGIALALTPGRDRVDPPSGLVNAELAGDRVEARVRRIENATGGVVVVVEGRLPESARTSQRVRLRVGWLDAEGAPLSGATAIAGVPLPTHVLRERSAQRLAAEHAAHALELTAGGPFQAVFGEVPAGAGGLSLSREHVPVTIPVGSPESEAPTASTASSRPAAPPSSE